MTLTKVLWASLTGCIGIILLMTASWASDVARTNAVLTERLNLTEQRYAAIQVDLQALRDDVKDLKALLGLHQLAEWRALPGVSEAMPKKQVR